MKLNLPFALVIIAVATISFSHLAPAGPLKETLRERLLKRLQDKPAPAVNAQVTDKITEAGDYTFSIQQGGLTRMYMVHVPKSYIPEKPAPMLFAIHGGGGDMAYMARDEFYGQVSQSEKRGFVVVFPNGYSKFRSGIFATWNAGDCCGNARDQNIDDVSFFRAMVANITGQMNIDRDKIYATGMSNGGMMSERLACEMADVFKAIASVAGPDGTKKCKPARPISILQIHAKDDDHVLFNGGAGQGAFRDETKVTNFTSIPETVSRWVKRDGCGEKPQRVLDVADGTYCDLYSPCEGGTQVKLCVTATGAHSWPGGAKPAGIKRKVNSQAISANDEMWKFFESLD